MEGRACRSLGTCIALVLLLGLASSVAADLKVGFYSGKCKAPPGNSSGKGKGQGSGKANGGTDVNVESVVTSAVKKAFQADNTICASLIRLHFHDCFVQGCDSSVLLDTPDSEKNALPNLNSLRGYSVIDSIKATVENLCPSLVSCADILALAARDCIALLKGQSYAVPTGRFDGLTSGGTQGPLTSLPAPFHDITKLVSTFAAVGLNKTDLVLLSGVHTVGRARCLTFSNRLYDSAGNPIQDPRLTPARSNQLRQLCPFGGDGSVLVPMDSSPLVVDTRYFQQEMRNESLFSSDDALRDDPDTAAVVQAEAKSPVFFGLGASMIKMGNIGALSSSNGQIRKFCNQTNT